MDNCNRMYYKDKLKESEFELKPSFYFKIGIRIFANYCKNECSQRSLLKHLYYDHEILVNNKTEVA